MAVEPQVEMTQTTHAFAVVDLQDRVSRLEELVAHLLKRRMGKPSTKLVEQAGLTATEEA
jgi:hypothetical protein